MQTVAVVGGEQVGGQPHGLLSAFPPSIHSTLLIVCTLGRCFVSSLILWPCQEVKEVLLACRAHWAERRLCLFVCFSVFCILSTSSFRRRYVMCPFVTQTSKKNVGSFITRYAICDMGCIMQRFCFWYFSIAAVQCSNRPCFLGCCLTF